MPGSNSTEGMLRSPLPAVDDEEGERIPEGLPPVIDAHVHLFPDHLFKAVWKWFDQHGWPIRYQLPSAEVPRFLLSRGAAHAVLLHYAHKPGVARDLNTFMASVCQQDPRLHGMATVFPGEDDAKTILAEGFEQGLIGVKLHAHVQCFDMTGEEMRPVYEACVEHDKPLLMHVGREPKSPAYPCDPYAICDAARLERVLRDYPLLRICVPHMGADEFDAYRDLLDRYDTLWLDTTMALADYLPISDPPALSSFRLDRVLYGSDFPNIPYAWDRELKLLTGLGLSRDQLTAVLGASAAALYGISLS